MTTKEEYIEWRAEWRKRYANLSEDIRETKLFIKNEFKAGGRPGSSQYTILGMKATATAMLEDRKESKIKANEIWLATHS